MHQSTMNSLFLRILWGIWSIRKAIIHVIAIVSMLTTILYLMYGETLEQRRVMLEQFTKDQVAVSRAEASFKDAGDAAFKGPSQNGRSITDADARLLTQATRSLRSALLSSTTPNGAIQKARIEYTDSLATLQGKLNLFTPGSNGTIAVLRALNAVEKPAADYHDAARSYQNSVWVSFWAAF